MDNLPDAVKMTYVSAETVLKTEEQMNRAEKTSLADRIAGKKKQINEKHNGRKRSKGMEL